MAGRRDVWNALNRLKAALAASSGGAVGNAAAADVVSGKTFSSATAGTGVSGTNTKNATVPNDAPIQPPQAFVDSFNQPAFSNQIFSFANLGITHFDASIVVNNIFKFKTSSVSIDLSGNALNASEINAILTWYAGNAAGIFDSQPLDLSGGTSAAPTIDGALVLNTNDSSGNYSQRGTHNGKPYYNQVGSEDSLTILAIVWSGTQWQIFSSGGALDSASPDNVSAPWLASTWTNSASVTGINVAKQVLQDGGWTVTTN